MHIWQRARFDYLVYLFFGGIGMFLCAWVTYMAFDKEAPFEYDAVNSKVFVSRIDPYDLEKVSVAWALKRVNRFCPGRNRRELFDPVSRAILATYSSVVVATPADVRNNILHVSFFVPSTLKKQKIGYRAQLFYSCNLLQRWFPLQITTPELFFDLTETK